MKGCRHMSRRACIQMMMREKREQLSTNVEYQVNPTSIKEVINQVEFYRGIMITCNLNMQLHDN